jgi:site-specific recombinase XerD
VERQKMKNLTLYTVEKIYLKYLTECGYKDKTIKSKLFYVRKFCEYLRQSGISDIRDVTTRIVEKYALYVCTLKAKQSGKLLAAVTRKSCIFEVRQLFGYLYMKELIIMNPAHRNNKD